MAKKCRLLLLDANVVIELFRLGIWDSVVDRYEIHLSRTVVGEAAFFEDDNGDRQDIDLTQDETNARISVFTRTPSQLDNFRGRFDSIYFEKLDAGEAESLSFLMEQGNDCLMCSADKIVYRVLGNLNQGDQGVSLEEALASIGLRRNVDREFTRTYREEWTRKGSQENIQGIGVKRS